MEDLILKFSNVDKKIQSYMSSVENSRNSSQFSEIDDIDILGSQNIHINIPVSPKIKLISQVVKKNQKNLQSTQKKEHSFLTFNSLLLQTKTKMPKVVEKKQFKEVIKNGHIIQGYWENQKLQGQVLIKYSNGDQFMGKFQNGLRVEGQYIYKNGDSYKGQFLGQFFHGKGVFKIKEKKIKIQGRWASGILDGFAKVTYKNNDVYYGCYSDMKKEGWGHYFFQNGTKYTGNFVNGKIEGKGTLYDQFDAVIADGIWLNGQLQNSLKVSNIFTS